MFKILIYVKFFLVFLYIYICSAENDNRIIGGRHAKEGEFPFQVSIRRSYNDHFFCSGSIISSKYILTAAHCMYYVWGGVLPPIVISIIAGQLQLNTTSNSVYRNASKIIIHSQYNKTSMTNDIAIIELLENLPANNKLITPITLRTTTECNLNCLVVGWGVQKFNSTKVSNDLLAVDVSTITFPVCSSKYSKANIKLVEGMLCASNNEKEADACQGDSGGPLICDGKLTGIVSTGRSCADTNYPGIYTDIVYFISWIKNVTELDFDLTMTRNSSLSTITNSYFYKQSTTISQIFHNTQLEISTYNITLSSNNVSDFNISSEMNSSFNHLNFNIHVFVFSVMIVNFF